MSPALSFRRHGAIGTYVSTIRRGLRSLDPRSLSTVAGITGRQYVPGHILQSGSELLPFTTVQASCEGNSYILKYMPNRRWFDHLQSVAANFGHSSRLLMPVDSNEQESAVILPKFSNSLSRIIENNLEFPDGVRSKVLVSVAEAIKEMHDQDWLHLDICPDNVLINYSSDGNGEKTVKNVALGAFECAHKLDDGLAMCVQYPIGDVTWRSLETQTGTFISKASDIYSFGLLCLYTLGAKDLLVYDDVEELQKKKFTLQQEILARHLALFGPTLPEALMSRIKKEIWHKELNAAATAASKTLEMNPKWSFRYWGGSLGPEAYDLFSRMTNLNPWARPTIEQVLKHSVWDED
ncbi:unnamed protein product [Periconia digitata]|uniref:Protein kinase domain-containing protein n=1 Tax=Periconia digitata TaxID=1303443 RepID=A0A9W4U556_9PLEO|nr:unnamed protein product [Periconia digitata]